MIMAFTALAFGINPQSSYASESKNIGSELVRSGGSATYDAENEQILVSLRTDQLERVLIQVADATGNLVFVEQVTVNARGLEMKISLQGMASGIYHIKMRGETIAIGNRIKKK